MAQERYYALDVFRGATVALMILVNNPGTWAHMFAPLKHADWHGLTPTDLVFPFFLFAVGNAMAFVMPKLQLGGASLFWRKVIKRTVIIFGIGLFLNWWPFLQWKGEDLVLRAWVDVEDPTRGVRVMGVLQRIALAYFLASVLAYYLRWRALVWSGLGILLLYWGLCWTFGGADPYSLAGWFGTKIDLSLIGVAHLYKGEGVPFDPEGLMSTLPAVVQVLGGYLVGLLIVGGVQTATESRLYYRLSRLMVLGVWIALIGLLWSLEFPINKKIWTSSYVLLTTGLAMLCIGVMIWHLEIRGARYALTRFFDVFGKNPLFIFVLSGLLPRALALIRWQKGVNDSGGAVDQTPLRWFYENVCAPIPGPPALGSFVYSICFLLLFWYLAYWLDKNKIYIKV